jgi:hypothetical protein
MKANLPFPTIKRSLQLHPSIFPNVYRVLEHIFLTNGNGYEVDSHGNLASRESENKISITDEGLRWLSHDMLGCDCYTVYPINSFDYEEKHKLGANRYYTDIYAYPAMNAEWQRAARWFLWQLLSRDAAWWRKHYRALDANPARRSYGAKYLADYYPKMMEARRHLGAFVKRIGIKLDDRDASLWEFDLHLHLDPSRATR